MIGALSYLCQGIMNSSPLKIWRQLKHEWIFFVGIWPSRILVMSLDITQKSTEKRTARRINEDDVVKKAHNLPPLLFTVPSWGWKFFLTQCSEFCLANITRPFLFLRIFLPGKTDRNTFSSILFDSVFRILLGQHYQAFSFLRIFLTGKKDRNTFSSI